MKETLSGVALIAAIITLMCGGVAWWGWTTEQRQASWPVTNGRVLSSEVVRRWEDMHSTRGGGGSVERWVFQISYAFKVGGRAWTGHGLTMTVHMANVGASAAPPAALSALVAAYPAGRPVTVHYDPSNPGRSVLQLDTSASHILGGAAALAALIAITTWRLAQLRALRTKQS